MMNSNTIPNPPIEPLLTPDEVAVRLNCSRSQVYDMFREQTLPFIRVGKLYRVRPSALRAFIGNEEKS